MAELKTLALKAVDVLKKPVVTHTLVAIAAKSVYSKTALAVLLSLLGIAG